MTTLKLSEQVQLAEASYGEFLPTDGQPSEAQVETALLAKAFSTTQVQSLVQSYTALHHRPNTASGFSATLFQSNDPGNPGLTLALRGTEPAAQGGVDLIQADLGGIVITGAALYQIIDLYNYWTQLTAGQNATVRLARIVSTTDSNAAGIFATVAGGTPSDPQVSYRRIEFFDQPNAGLGVITGPVAGLTVTGHSLGGHLATAFERLFSDTVGAVYTVNGAGTRETTEVSLFFDALAERLTAFDASKVVNIFGSAGPNVATGELVYDQIGSRVELFTESIMDAFGHGNKQMTDSAAVYDLFIRLDALSRSGTPAEALAKLKPLVEAGSAQAGSSLELLVDSLVKLFGLDFTPLAGALIGDREALYQRLVPLRSIAANLSTNNSGMVVDVLANIAAIDLANIAQGSTAFGYRYALRELNPFAILGDNDLYAPHNQTGELDLYDAVNRTGTLTEDWIKDRANLLYAEIIRNTQDNPDLARLPGSGDRVTEYHHYRSGKEEVFFAQYANWLPNQFPTQMVMFADDAGRLLTGTNNLLGDRLYGGAGTDYLIGKANDDSLEGGKGLDIYQYNASNGANDGADVVRDTDGKGVLRYAFTQSGLFSSTVQSTVIADASVRVSGLQWNSADGRFSYIRSQNDLIIDINDSAGGSITLKDFKEGDFGIRLLEARATPQTTNTINAADYQDNQTIFDTAANDLILGDARNNGINASTGGSNWIQAGDGRDMVYTLTTSVTDTHLIEGGTGDDLLTGGPGNDELYANVRVDLAQASSAGNGAGNGAHGDWLSGDWGDDVLVGDVSNDGFAAGVGKDIVIAGAGDDNIFGDADWVGTTLDWFYEDDPATNTRSFYWFNGAENYDVGDADIIYAGSGDDYVWAGGGDDLVWGELGNDQLVGQSGSDVLIGGAGDDRLWGDDGRLAIAQYGDDYLDGGGGNDFLSGEAGNDVLIGGPGNDTLSGGTGKDIYVFNKGDGTETVFDADTNPNNPDASVLVLGDGVSPSAIKFTPGSLAVDIGPSDPADPNSPHDVIHFNGFNQLDPIATTPLAEIRFADGTGMSYADILAQGFDVDGTEGNDTGQPGDAPQLVGTGVTDRIRGFGGNDVLFGLAGDDVLDGGDGADQLIGGPGADTIHGGAGDDQIWADGESGGVVAPDGADVVYGGAGNDVVQGYDGDDQIFGDDDNDTLHGQAGADYMEGGDGDDFLWGDDSTAPLADQGNDTLDGGAGNDQLVGDAGNDTYVFGRGYGQDIIFDEDTTTGNIDRVELAADITLGDVTASQQAGTFNLLLAINGTTDVLTIANHFFSPVDRVEEIRFADGTVWTPTTTPLLIRGTVGNNVLNGTSGPDVFEGLAGNDIMSGGAGNDSYRIFRGDGQDTITDSDATVGNVDKILYASDILPSDIQPSRSGDNLVLRLTGTTDQVTISHYFQNDGVTSFSVEQINFLADGTVWDVDTVKQMVLTGTTGNDTITGYATDDTLIGLGGNDILGGNAGNDLLNGGTGNDVLEGGTGNDTYVIARGDGQDTITDVDATVGNVDRIQYAADILPSAMQVTRSSNDLVLALTGTADRIFVRNYFQNDGVTSFSVEQIDFLADGTVWDIDTVKQMVLTGTNSGETIIGYATDDTLTGLGGNDNLIGNAGDDTLDGGAGNDQLNGGTGNDTYLIARGDGQDLLSDVDSTAGNVDRLVYAADILPSEIQVTRAGSLFEWNHLVLKLAGTTDFVRIGDYFQNDGVNSKLVEQIEFAVDGTTWDVNAVKLLALTGTSGNDTIVGYATDDFLSGLGGDDSHYGGAGNDTFDGGIGSDYMEGGAGDDEYRIYRGSGTDRIFDSFGTDRVVYAEDILPSQVQVTRNPSSLLTVLHLADTSDFLLLDNQYDQNPPWVIDEIQFLADGTVWDVNTVKAMAITPTSGSDNIVGYATNDSLSGLAGDDFIYGDLGDDTLDGGTGNDVLYGEEGSDTYLFGLGYGADDIYNHLLGFSPHMDSFGSTDVLQFGAGIAPSQVSISKSGNDLFLQINGTADRIAIRNYFLGELATVEEIRFADGTVWTEQTITPQFPVNGTAGNDNIQGTSLSDAINGLAGNDTIFGAEGNDIIDGGTGSDSLIGGVGDDTLLAGTGDRKNAAVSNTLYGGTGNDVLISSGKTDTLYGESGNDIMIGAGGVDLLQDYLGNNLFFGAAGVDTIRMGDGNDIALGGAGNDAGDGDFDANGVRGRDILAFNKSDGVDTVDRLGTGSTLSIGGGTLYSNLSLEVSGTALRLKTASSSYISLSDWYAATPNKSVSTLQIVIEGTRGYKATSANPMNNRKIQTFDFIGLVNAFDAARAAGQTFNVANNLATYRIGGSDTEMIGGAIAYQYARTGSLGTLTYSQMQAVINDPAFGVSAQLIAAPTGAAALDAETAAGASADTFAAVTLAADTTTSTRDATSNASADSGVTSDQMVQADSIAGETDAGGAEEGATPPIPDFVTLPDAAIEHLPILPERAAARIPPEFLAPPAVVLPSFESSTPGAAVAGARAAHAFGSTLQSAGTPESRLASHEPLVDDTPTGMGASGAQGDAAHIANTTSSTADDEKPGTDSLFEDWFARHSWNDDLTLLDEIVRGDSSASASVNDGTIAAAWRRSHAWLNGHLNTGYGADNDAFGGSDPGAASLLSDTGTFIDMPRPVVGLRNVAGHDLKLFNGLRDGVNVLGQS